MPKLRRSAEENRRRAWNLAVARCQIDEELLLDQDIAERLKMKPNTYSKRKRNLYRSFGFEEAGKFARALKMTGREVCEILGVPYDDPKN